MSNNADSVDPYRSRLCRGNALWMARLADAVYTRVAPNDPAPDEQPTLEALAARDPGFRSVTSTDAESAQGMVVEHDDYLAMVFRGTDELSDWMDNFNAFQIDRLGGGFHRGFWQSLDAIWAPLNTRYRDLRREKKRPLFLVGHSLGGAMATIAAARFVHDDEPFNAVYTFGAPRAMNRETSRRFNSEAGSRCYRFHNNNDLVTRVPARIMGYSHVGTYLYISEEQTIIADPGFWYRFLDYVDGAYESALTHGFDGFEDHDIERYLAAIDTWRFEVA